MEDRVKVDLAGGGWVLLLALALCALVLIWHLSMILGGQGSHATGNGRSLTSYGFDLSNLKIPREQLVAAGIPKDGLRALVRPRVVSVSSIEEMRRKGRGKFLVSSDRVIGVTIAGQARAYPLRVLAWHEVANDELGGRAIAVTYSPLCDSAVVFSRIVGGEAVEFGVSGLLYNSNLVMYDRKPLPSEESLWSQLRFEAIAGPAAKRGRRLEVLPASVVRWADWKAWHPEATVVVGLPRLGAAYKRDPYVSYYGSDRLRFPVSPLPESGKWDKKTPVIAVGVGTEGVVFPLPVIAARAGVTGKWGVQVGGTELRFAYAEWPPTAWVETARDKPVRATYAFWFAWHSMHPAEKIWGQ